MKRILSLLLILLFVFVLSACGKDKDTTVKDGTNKASEQTGTTKFVKPENYATVLFVKINPEFNLYLDAEGNTLAIEPLNDDAKSIVKDFNTTEKDYQKVISIIITSANEKGFVKTDAHINISATENKADNVNVDEILSNANIIATQTATSLNIEVKIETSSDIKTLDETSKPSDTSETNKPTETSKPSHTHTYAKATCTKPQTCSCGATKGEAQGHKWSDATCQTPKTCTVCKMATGNKVTHAYENSKCKYCGHELASTLKTNHKYTTCNYFEDSANTITLTFNDKGVVTFDFNFYSTSDEEADDLTNNIKHDGKTYYWIGGGGNVPYSYTISKNEIVISDENVATKKLTILSNGTLKATYSDGNDFLAGSVFN